MSDDPSKGTAGAAGTQTDPAAGGGQPDPDATWKRIESIVDERVDDKLTKILDARLEFTAPGSGGGSPGDGAGSGGGTALPAGDNGAGDEQKPSLIDKLLGLG